ncbi:uncharacterized protein LOC26534779 [Drosophila yakuba]|uniref:Protein sleepless n=1 Tax=Drosophila yakuba TaxID=7245 RepID=A0A0R1DRF4_DROYA|nr:uncharacterized protein LOC26534779 [Drosophila yakuba]KRJ99582.1 uncharacterized protein Dyak_GE27598 [Drosophila yakuba]
MKVLYQAVILLGLFKLLTSIELTTVNNTMCVDCSKDNQVKCIIEETGFECFNEHAKMKHSHEKPTPPSTVDLDICIPKGLKIRCIDESTFLKVIVWSPELGCQIVHRDYQNRDTCFTATLFCPCVKDARASGKVQSTNSLLLVITLYLVQLEITKIN